MNNPISLILVIFFLASCGRKSDPTPETKDSYPRTYPAPSAQSLRDDETHSTSESSAQLN